MSSIDPLDDWQLRRAASRISELEKRVGRLEEDKKLLKDDAERLRRLRCAVEKYLMNDGDRDRLLHALKVAYPNSGE